MAELNEERCQLFALIRLLRQIDLAETDWILLLQKAEQAFGISDSTLIDLISASTRIPHAKSLSNRLSKVKWISRSKETNL